MTGWHRWRRSFSTNCSLVYTGTLLSTCVYLTCRGCITLQIPACVVALWDTIRATKRATTLRANSNERETYDTAVAGLQSKGFAIRRVRQIWMRSAHLASGCGGDAKRST